MTMVADGLIANGWIGGVSPLDATALEQVAVTTPDQLAVTVAQAHTAQAEWACWPLKERTHMLKQAGQHLMAHADAIAAGLHHELGKPLTDCYTVDLGSAPEVFRYYTRHAAQLLASESVRFNRIQFPHKKGVVERIPHGCIGLITPWNYPVSIPLHNLVPALLGGNSVVWKPSEYAPRTGAIVAGLLNEKLPPGLLGLVQGDGATGAALIGSGIAAVVFVGGAVGGRAVAHAAADHLIPALLELGGKDAAIVLADADLERAAHGIAWAGLVNAGQSCAAVERIYVVRSVAPAFEQALVKVVQKLRLGDDVDGRGSVEIGPISTAAQFAAIDAQVKAAISQGATPLYQAALPDTLGRYYAPIVLTNVTADMEVMRQETFGPVLPIQLVADADEAVRCANQTHYGLTASVWTGDLKAGALVARQLKAGVVTLNNHMFTGAAPQAAWSGQGSSGYGVQNGRLAVLALTRPRLLAVDASQVKRELWWFPYDRALYDLGRGLLLWNGAAGSWRGWRRKLGGALQMMRGVIMRLK